ncbi:hypothetical protein [Caulobacter vibrioides]|uniref:hypothetical protein n=1 Tax=Caulobacter vibrioides TaxID=155892 RepID=UPI000BB4B679|nr:hypothetical protein [Caulobacter vibrioides]ATC23450.1 hypothetical protein CA608_02320 [Caulobacter vibrioides]PLR11963.1 hypothetical protein CVUC_11265 [Caulobacter vibrioides]
MISAIAAAEAVSASSLKGDLVTLDALNTGRAFALLDSGWRLMECSAGFEALFKSQATLSVSRGRLVASLPGERTMVERFLAALIGVRRLRNAPSPLRLRSSEGGRGLVLRAVPVPPTNQVFELFQPAAVLTPTDLDRSNRVRR